MLKLYTDYRFGGIPRYYVAEAPDHLMLVPDEFQKCVMFIGYQKPDTTYSTLGTAFIVMVRDETGGGAFGYIVTAKHIIDKIRAKKLDKVCLRINTHTGREWIDTKIGDWLTHPDDYRVDVAVLQFSLPMETFDFSVISVSQAATKAAIKSNGIGLGNEVFIVGLFTEHGGQSKNLPIVRVGNVALMSDEPVEVMMFGGRENIDAYLIEARSIGGLSGSPVFVRTDFRPKTATPAQTVSETVFWFGLVRGHWDVPVKTDEIEEDDTSVPREEKVNMGIAIVVPVTKILEVINQEKFVDYRNKRNEEIRRRHLPTEDSVDEGDDEPEFTEADFEDALRKVSRKDKPEGDTQK